MKQLLTQLAQLFLFVCLLVAPSAAQTPEPIAQALSPNELNITIGEQRLKFAPTRAFQELRLNVFNHAGELVYGAVSAEAELLWNVRDNNGAALAPGLYSYVVALKYTENETTREQRGHFIIEKGQDQLWLTNHTGAELSGGALTAARAGGRSIAGLRTAEADKTSRAVSGREIVDDQGNKLTEAKDDKKAKQEKAALLGTQNRVAKFDAGGVNLIDSAMTDTGHVTIDSSTNLQAAGLGSLIIEGQSNKERVELRSAGGTPGPALQGKGFGGTIAAPTATLANTDLFIIGGSGHNGSGLVTLNAGTVKIKAEQTWTPSANGSYINFETTPSGSTTAARTERMRITGAGNVGIGVIPAAGNIRLDVNGNLLIRTPGSGGNVQFGTPAGKSGMSIINTNRADVRFDDSTLNLVAGPGTGAPLDTNGISIEAATGNVGMGTISPFSKLDVRTSSNATAIRGESNADDGNGVFGQALVGSSPIGVYGSSSSPFFCAGCRAGYFSGSVDVVGNLSKSGGSFKIDHPLDPENKYLLHSFVESPDMMNIYDGTVTTDQNGVVVVEMPDYFAALNRDFRYQLTVIGQFAQAIIADEIKDNHFTIRTDKPGVKVSWQVTGIRQDAYANQNRIQVEEEKSAKERGSYLHPEAHGQAEEKGAQWALRPEMMKEMKERREQARKQQAQPPKP